MKIALSGVRYGFCAPRTYREINIIVGPHRFYAVLNGQTNSLPFWGTRHRAGGFEIGFGKILQITRYLFGNQARAHAYHFCLFNGRVWFGKSVTRHVIL